jgi:hypothetical protein
LDISLKREFTADFINGVANDPSVKGGSKLGGYTDLSELISLDNVLLTYEFGGFILINKGGGTYEVHTMALKQGRGKLLRENIGKAMEYMFFETDCLRLVTMAYKDNPASMALSDAYFDCKGETEEYKYYERHYSDWVSGCDRAKSEGDSFHLGVEQTHEDDDYHDYHVGGAMILLKNGNIGKGVQVYNDWAAMSGYASIEVIGVTPLIIEVGEMTLIYHNQELEEICH